MLASLAIILAVVGTAVLLRTRQALAPRASQQACQDLLHRYLDQASRQLRPDANETDIALAQQRAHNAPSGVADVQTCQQQLSQSQVACGLQAANIDALERCLQ